MSKKSIVLALVFAIASLQSSWVLAQKPQGSIQETIIDKKNGFFTCAGGSSVPLFKQDCKILILNRVSFGGDIRYEAQCTDSSGNEYTISCIAFSFEPNAAAAQPNPGFFQ